MKKLLIYKENNEFIIERVNEFNHSTKRFFISEAGLFEGLQAYKEVIDEYELEVSKEFWAKVINFLNSAEMYLNSNHGGKREGAGRPSLGTTKKVSLTLPDEIWEMIEERKEKLGVSQSQTLRMMIERYFYTESEDKK